MPWTLRRFGLQPLLAGLGLLCFLQQPCHADVWGYIDARGVAHFASEPLDARYALFFRQGSPQDPRTRHERREAHDATPRAVAAPTTPPGLLAFFEISTGYKSVRPLLREVAASQALDHALLQALILTESGFDAKAVSPRGAVGLMQVLPTTAQGLGVLPEGPQTVEKKLTDPGINLRTGARHLRHLMNLYPGRLDLALAAYNAGEGAVARAGHQVPPIRETQDYVNTVLQLYQLLQPPAPLAPRSPALLAQGPLPGAATGPRGLPTAARPLPPFPTHD